MTRRLGLAGVSALCLMLAACAPAAKDAPAAETPAVAEPAAEPAAEPPHAAAHWTYDDQAHWGETCPVGKAQSPIALVSGGPVEDLPDLTISAGAGAGAFLDNGHTLQFTPTAPGALTIGADAYKLGQFHFHDPSEHTLDGVSYPAEVHFVHKDAAGNLAVVGVFIKEGAANPALASLLAAIPAGEGDANATSPTVDPASLLPVDHTYFAYKGSLTTPPCSENVRWNVLKSPVEASAEQIAALQTALGRTNREVQPLNARETHVGQ